jgi:hypothetical protein
MSISQQALPKVSNIAESFRLLNGRSQGRCATYIEHSRAALPSALPGGIAVGTVWRHCLAALEAARPPIWASLR